MPKQPISITAINTISSLGSSPDEIKAAYNKTSHCFNYTNNTWVSSLKEKDKSLINTIKEENNKYQNLDPTVLMALYSSRLAIKQAGWDDKSNFGVNFGSSRGATSLFEEHHNYFLNNQKAKTLTSPTTTLGNISSWVAHDLQSKGPTISHSITCSTALHAILNGVTWLESGRCDSFLVGGSEAPLTPFTIAQMRALKIYSQANIDTDFPCRAMDLKKEKNSMILGEAAGSLCLENGLKENRIAQISGLGYGTEILTHNASLSKEGSCFIDSMKMALKEASLNNVDAIVTHTPGTKKGDASEINAIKSIFKNIPYLTNNKWKIGHSLGASGLLSLELALLMLTENKVIQTPFTDQKAPHNINSIMVNAVGFGGNAVSIIIKK